MLNPRLTWRAITYWLFGCIPTLIPTPHYDNKLDFALEVLFLHAPRIFLTNVWLRTGADEPYRYFVKTSPHAQLVVTALHLFHGCIFDENKDGRWCERMW